MKKKILLVSAPWASIYMPSVQICGLKTFLESQGIAIDVEHSFLLYANRIGPIVYDYVPNCCHLPTEGIFASLIYPRMKNNVVRLIEKKQKYKIDVEKLIKQGELFIEEIVRDLDFSKYEYVGFSINFYQLFSSIALAKRIKEVYPDIKIVFGGNDCSMEKGYSIMEVYPEVDFVVSLEGEYPLLNLLKGKRLRDIPGIIYREEEKIYMNRVNTRLVSLDSLPPPDCDDYFIKLQDLKRLRNCVELKINISIPLETSRGCWWGKCTFCTFNAQFQTYREKSPYNIKKEIMLQKRKYLVNCFSFLGNNNTIDQHKKLFKTLKSLNLKISLEYTAKFCNFNLLRSLKYAGVTKIQFGLESLSKKMLEHKICKGTKVIDNIQMLVWLRELNIVPASNIIYGYPNETKAELKECISNMKYLYHLKPPLPIRLSLDYNSPIYKNPGMFNIRKIEKSNIYHSFIPRDVLKKIILYRYDFKQRYKTGITYNVLFREINHWKRKYQQSKALLLYFKIKKQKKLEIIDRRYNNKFRYFLNSLESNIYIYCRSYKPLQEIYRHFYKEKEKEINSILDYFVRNKLIYKEDNLYLSLAIDLKNHKKYLELKS